MTATHHVVGGVDPHAATIHVAVVSVVGKIVGDAEFATDPVGYARAVEFVSASGTVDRVGVEGAAGYGAGITRALRAAGVHVVEVERPTRSPRRRAGKSDQLDAYHAARSVLADRSSPVKDPAVDGFAGPAPGSSVRGQGAHRGSQPDEGDPGHGARPIAGEVPRPGHRRPGGLGAEVPQL